MGAHEFPRKAGSFDAVLYTQFCTCAYPLSALPPCLQEARAPSDSQTMMDCLPKGDNTRSFNAVGTTSWVETPPLSHAELGEAAVGSSSTIAAPQGPVLIATSSTLLAKQREEGAGGWWPWHEDGGSHRPGCHRVAKTWGRCRSAVSLATAP